MYSPVTLRQLAASLICAVLCVAEVNGRGTDFMLSGTPSSCSGLDLNGQWLVQGDTASGRPWYQHKQRNGDSAYMYFDPDCAWDGEMMEGGVDSGFGPAWIISTDPPNLDATSNLSGKQRCENVAHTVLASNNNKPPSIVEWDLVCWTAGEHVRSMPIRWRLGISDRPADQEVHR